MCERAVFLLAMQAFLPGRMVGIGMFRAGQSHFRLSLSNINLKQIQLPKPELQAEVRKLSRTRYYSERKQLAVSTRKQHTLLFWVLVKSAKGPPN